MGTETTSIKSPMRTSEEYTVKLNNPLMGTETYSLKIKSMSEHSISR